MSRTCRIDGSDVAAITRDANRSIVGNHPLAVVRYACGHWEFVRHDELSTPVDGQQSRYRPMASPLTEGER